MKFKAGVRIRNPPVSRTMSGRRSRAGPAGRGDAHPDIPFSSGWGQEGYRSPGALPPTPLFPSPEELALKHAPSLCSFWSAAPAYGRGAQRRLLQTPPVSAFPALVRLIGSCQTKVGCRGIICIPSWLRNTCAHAQSSVLQCHCAQLQAACYCCCSASACSGQYSPHIF